MIEKQIFQLTTFCIQIAYQFRVISRNMHILRCSKTKQKVVSLMQAYSQENRAGQLKNVTSRLNTKNLVCHFRDTSKWIILTLMCRPPQELLASVSYRFHALSKMPKNKVSCVTSILEESLPYKTELQLILDDFCSNLLHSKYVVFH